MYVFIGSPIKLVLLEQVITLNKFTSIIVSIPILHNTLELMRSVALCTTYQNQSYTMVGHYRSIMDRFFWSLNCCAWLKFIGKHKHKITTLQAWFMMLLVRTKSDLTAQFIAVVLLNNKQSLWPPCKSNMVSLARPSQTRSVPRHASYSRPTSSPFLGWCCFLAAENEANIEPV